MLLFLATELIEHIVRLAIPSEYSSATYLERQATLRTLCLVSRQLRSLAQPILQEVALIKAPKATEPLDKHFDTDGGGAFSRLRVLAIEMGSQVDLNATAALRDVRLYKLKDQVDLSWLEGLPALERLVLSLSSITSDDFCLPSVKELTWVRTTTATTLPVSPISPKTFPNLVHLAFWMETYSGKEGAWAPQLTTEDLEHVKTLVISHPIANKPYSALHPAVLVDLPFQSIFSSDILPHVSDGAQNLRFYRTFGTLPTEGVTSVVEAILNTLSDPSFPSSDLKLLYLPTACRPSSTDSEDHAAAISGLLEHCKAEDIEVDFEDTDEFANGSLVSLAFIEHLKSSKESRQGVESCGSGAA